MQVEYCRDVYVQYILSPGKEEYQWVYCLVDMFLHSGYKMLIG